MALGISLIEATGDTLEVEATGFSSAVNVINWYIDNAYKGSVYRGHDDWPCWTFTDLYPDTEYTIKAAFYASAGSSLLDKVEKPFSTKYVEPVAEVYYAKLIINGNGATYNGSSTITFDDPGWTSSWDGSAEVPVDYDASYFTRTGYTLLGVDPSSSRTSPRYSIEGRYYVTSDSTNSSEPDSETLYAIWKKITLEEWSWPSSVSPGNEISITAKKWNEFVDYIKTYADLKGITLNTTTLSNAKATSTNRMLASQANAVCSLLSAVGATPPGEVTKDVTPITAQFFYDLRDCFNNLL